VQGAVLMMCMIFRVVNLIVDVIYVFLDPRISYIKR
jgi:peptide/nickel transport system permease protein